MCTLSVQGMPFGETDTVSLCITVLPVQSIIMGYGETDTFLYRT